MKIDIYGKLLWAPVHHLVLKAIVEVGICLGLPYPGEDSSGYSASMTYQCRCKKA